MKKKLLLGAFLFGSLLTVKAQTSSYDFSDLTVGQVATDVTGATAGQGGWYVLGQNGTTTTTTNMNADTFQVVDNGGANGNVIQVTGPNGSAGGAFMWQAGTDTFWANRTAGNDVFEVEYDYYTGTASTSLNRIGVYIYEETYNAVLGGIVVSTNNLEVLGVAYSQPQGATSPANYTYSLGTEEEPNVMLPENTWVTLKISYNYNTGLVLWSVDGYIEEGTAGAYTVTETVPFEVDLTTTSGSTETTTNAAAGTGLIDNLSVTAVAEVLGADEFLASQFSVYPNPVSDVINIANAENILVNGVEIVDLNGRVVKSAKFNGVSEAQVNISDLSAGMYLMNVSSDKGTTTKKIVKN
ncbi:T9SS type A sorting domain-containing protein [Flavobacterium rakeshii]|uniref:T9SS type A sorting domain-containing protein n=1 Tax=Flavobacterium rakeshii TaxID=1038845 RepID=UPI002E7B7459|nr:T9SS type A sorting domain-containing protein [Flavobacterium rakeshii]MEE1899477.1 T9SS type A sorting domain-containing protein [Flavobacterium rakeshii]